jgi:hypothetical protein
MIAKNVGIRRARGQFVLATNVDVIFSDELIEYLATTTLDERLFYRIDRYDVHGDIPGDIPIEDQLELCSHNVIRVNTKYGIFTPTELRRRRLISLQRDLNGLLASHDFGERRRHLRQYLRQSLRFLRNRINPPFPHLHTNACGDFTLMARQKWHVLRGYSEREMHSFHLDSLLLHAAYQYGLQEKILQENMRLYHLEHSSGWTPQTGSVMYRRLQKIGVPVLSSKEFEALATRMQYEKRPLIHNSQNWGLGSDDLREIEIN